MRINQCDKNLYGRHRFNTMSRKTLRDELGANKTDKNSVSVSNNENKISMTKSARVLNLRGGFFNGKMKNLSFGGSKWNKFLQSEKLASFLKSMNDVSWTESIFVCLLSLTIKPLAVMATPGAKKEDKQYSATKSFVSGFVDFGLSTATVLPITYAVKKFGKKLNDPKFAKNITQKVGYLKDEKKFDAFKKIVGYMPKFLMIPVRSALTIALIAPTMKYLFPNHKKSNKNKNVNDNEVNIKKALNENINSMKQTVKTINTGYFENVTKNFNNDYVVSDLRHKVSFKNLQEPCN